MAVVWLLTLSDVALIVTLGVAVWRSRRGYLDRRDIAIGSLIVGLSLFLGLFTLLV